MNKKSKEILGMFEIRKSTFSPHSDILHFVTDLHYSRPNRLTFVNGWSRREPRLKHPYFFSHIKKEVSVIRELQVNKIKL